MPEPSKPPFFPPLLFHKEKERNDFTVAWYGKHLAAMNEPSLWAASRDKSVQAYRFLWLRTFEPPIAVRLTMKPDGTSDAESVVTNGKGGYKPGRVVFHQKHVTPQKETATVLQTVTQIGYWNLPVENPSRFRYDGAQWILEGVKNGQYHLVDRWSPANNTPYKQLCLRFLDLGSIPTKARAKIY